MISLETIDSLLIWMEQNLNQSAPPISLEDIQRFFAPSFKIITNNKIVEASPSTYQKYLEEFRKEIKRVSYSVEEKIESPKKAIYVFNIYIEKENRVSLKVISIFSFNNKNKITQWREVFCSTDEPNLPY